MLEPSGEVNFTLEALGAERGGKLGKQDFKGDGTVVADVMGQVDHGHAAAAQLALEGVTVGERVAQALGHSDRGLLCRESTCSGTGSGRRSTT